MHFDMNGTILNKRDLTNGFPNTLSVYYDSGIDNKAYAGIPAEDLYEKNLNNLGHVKEILGLKGRTMLFKISAKKEHYVRRNIPFPVVKIKTDQLLLQQLCPDLLALDENEFNSDGPSSEGDDKFLEDCRSNRYGSLQLKLSLKSYNV
nr:uncharacterized protein LOC109163473 [Ipomoea batatas]GMC71890.1 uncharacterized protein LOC109163473 [Ipomoea batatas]